MKKSKISKKDLIKIAKKVERNEPIKPVELRKIVDFETEEKNTKVWDIIKRLGLPFSILFGLIIVMFPEFIENLISVLPPWLNLNERISNGLDYIWGIISNPIEKTHIIYHLPNILLYSFGLLEIRNLINAIKNTGWLNKVKTAKATLTERVLKGKNIWDLKPGFSILFTGSGDFIGEEIAKRNKDHAITLADNKPKYTSIWNKYRFDTTFEDLKETLILSDANDTGEYIFFPVQDTEIFLPSPSSYDISPHKLDLLIQNIRSTEDEMKWETKKIIVVGDKYHESTIETEDKESKLHGSLERISLSIIAKRNPSVTLIDPTDVVLQRILSISNGRKILFRASAQGLNEYKERFFARLEELGYKENKEEIETLTIGYDLFEDQTEQQSISNKKRDYLPVVLSSTVLDSLLKNGYRKDQLIYVPELVIDEIQRHASQQ